MRCGGGRFIFAVLAARLPLGRAIAEAVQCSDDRPDTAAAGFLFTAGTLEDVRQLARAAHGHMRSRSAISHGPMRAGRGGGERTGDPGRERRAGATIRLAASPTVLDAPGRMAEPAGEMPLTSL
jgi:hypothetical protein